MKFIFIKYFLSALESGLNIRIKLKINNDGEENNLKMKKKKSILTLGISTEKCRRNSKNLELCNPLVSKEFTSVFSPESCSFHFKR